MLKSAPVSMFDLSSTQVEGLLIAGLAVFIFLALRYANPPRRRRSDRPNPGIRPVAAVSPLFASHDMHDPGAQMHAIALIDFETTPLLNREEARLLPLLESIVRQINAGHRVMAQTSLGEVLRPKVTSGTANQRSAAYASINSKRLDFGIFDRFGRLIVAVEYQGTGHYQSHSFMRDAVKREVLRKAGVALLEVPATYVETDIRTSLTNLIGPLQRDR